MPLNVKLVNHPSINRHWNEDFRLLKNWKHGYRAPWLLLISMCEIISAGILFFQVILPSIRDIYVIRRFIVEKLCNNFQNDKPLPRIEDIAIYIDSFLDNLELAMTNSFMHLYFVNRSCPYDFALFWNNGSTTNTVDLNVSIQLFKHINELYVRTHLYSVIPNSPRSGCTKWLIQTKFFQYPGSFAFRTNINITRSHCPADFVSSISSSDSKTHNPIKSVNHKTNKGRHVLSHQHVRPKKNKMKIVNKQSPKNKNNEKYMVFKRRSINSPSPPKNLLPNHKHRQNAILYDLSYSLAMLAFSGTMILIGVLINQWRNHINWRNEDPYYNELEIAEQIHYSIGYWSVFHIISDFLLFVASVYLVVESNITTQFISTHSLRLFAVAISLSICVGTRWFIVSPPLYQLVLLIRTSITRLIDLAVGIIPLICAIMLLGVYLFGLVSDIQTSFLKFGQLFLGLAFGDNVLHVFSYYTDGSVHYNYLSFAYIVIAAIVASYIVYPAFTATVTFMHKTEVVPIEEQQSKN